VIARGAQPHVWPAPVEVRARWTELDIAGPPVGPELRAAGLAEQAVLVAGALGRNVDVLTVSGARASASYENGRVHVRLAAGDPLDEVVLRSYAIGAAHMALGWVLSEGLAVDDEGDVHDLTIRSFGILRASEMPPIDVEILPDDAPAREGSTDAVFGAVAAAVWLANGCPDKFPIAVRT
jgi:CO/xanthine dehydrogenase Mo-binding subunit